MSKLREVRKAAGITQEQLALVLNINRATISKYENGTIDIPVPQAKAISRFLKINWQELYPEDKQGAAIASDVIERAGLTLKKGEKVIHQGDGKPWVKVFLPPTPKERIDAAFGQLNEDGQEKAAESIEIIAGNPKFQRHSPTDAPESAPAPQEGTGTDTAETEKAPTDAPQRLQEDET